MVIDFNVGYVKSISREKFIEVFKDVYPHLDLGDEYDKIVPPKKVEKTYKAKDE